MVLVPMLVGFEAGILYQVLCVSFVFGKAKCHTIEGVQVDHCLLLEPLFSFSFTKQRRRPYHGPERYRAHTKSLQHYGAFSLFPQIRNFLRWTPLFKKLLHNTGCLGHQPARKKARATWRSEHFLRTYSRRHRTSVERFLRQPMENTTEFTGPAGRRDVPTPDAQKASVLSQAVLNAKRIDGVLGRLSCDYWRTQRNQESRVSSGDGAGWCQAVGRRRSYRLH